MDMALTALDLGFRGATVGLALLVCALLLRCDRPFRTLTTLRIALGAGAATYAISTAPFFPQGSFGWNAPLVILYAGSPVILWLWALAVFDDSFVLRPHHVAIWAVAAGLGLSAYGGWATSPMLSMISGRMLALVSVVFALLAAAQTLPGRRADLAAGRRRLLVAFLLATAAFVVANAALSLTAIPWRSVSFSYAFGLGLVVLLGVWTSVPEFMGQPALVGVVREAARKREAGARAAGLPPNRAWLRQREHVLKIERA
jgi:hypothetical protein